MRRCLVTGGAGFIGSALVHWFFNELERVFTFGILFQVGSVINMKFACLK